MKTVNRIFFTFSLFFLTMSAHGMTLLRAQRMAQRSATIMRSPIARNRINTSWQSTFSGWFTHVRNYCGLSAPFQATQKRHSTLINESPFATVEKEKPTASKEELEMLDFIEEFLNDAKQLSIISYSFANVENDDKYYKRIKKVLNSEISTTFFKNNSLDTICPIFERLIKTNSGCNFLTYYTDRSICAKLAPLVEEYLGTITKHVNGLNLVLHILTYAGQSNAHVASKLLELVKSQPSCLIQTSHYLRNATFFYKSLEELMDILLQYKNGLKQDNTNNEQKLYEKTIHSLEYYGSFIKDKLVQETNQENMQQLCSKIIQKPWSPYIIKSIRIRDIKENPNIIQALVAAFKEHFHHIKNNNDYDLFNFIEIYLKLTAMHSTETKEDLVIFLSKESDLFKITQSSSDADALRKTNILSTLLQELLSSEKNQELAKQSCLNLLLSPCDLKLDILLSTYAKIDMCDTHKTMLTSIIIPLIKEHFNHIISQNNGYGFINRVIYNMPLPKENLYEFLVAQKDTLIKHPEGLEILEIVLGSAQFKNNFPKLAFNVDSTHKTASYKHLKEYARIICKADSFLLNIPLNRMITQNSLKNMVQKILYKEKELEDSGYEVFYHGRRWEYGLITDMYSVLYEYKSGKPLNDFMFTHLDDPALGKKINPSFFKTEQAKRERLLKEGNPKDSKRDPERIANRQTLLFLNKFLFGNTTSPGSNSLGYILENYNQEDIAISIKEVFAMFGYSSAYKTYQQELEELSKEYNQLTSFGQLLLVAIPKNKVADCIYHTTGGGPKLSFPMTTCGADGKQTTVYETDINKILHYLHNNPIDVCQFVMIMTKDKNGGSNPESGIKVFPFNAVEAEKWAAFEEKRKALFARIVQTLEIDKTVEIDKKERIEETNSNQESWYTRFKQFIGIQQEARN